MVKRSLISYNPGMNHDIHFVVWILFNVAYTVYASGWASFSDSMMIRIVVLIEDDLQDLLMDWSLLERKSPHRFLRRELLYDHWRVSALGCRMGYLSC